MANPSRPFIGVFLLLVDNGKILLLRRHDDHLKDYFMPVAGHVDEGETLTGALIREAKEEANINIAQEDLKLCCIIHHPVAPYKGSNANIINFFFVCEKYEGTVKNNEPDKADMLDFYPLNNLTIPLSIHTKKAIDTYVNNLETPLNDTYKILLQTIPTGG